MTASVSVFVGFVVTLIAGAALIAVIVALAVPVSERNQRRHAMRRHPSGRHTQRFVHGGKR